MKDKLLIRKAEKEDSKTVLSFIKGLAEYEKLSHSVTATEDLIVKTLLSPNSKACALLGFKDDKAVAVAIYFYNYSTFLGKPGIYLEDLYVLPEERSKGYGKQILMKLATIARDEGCGRLEWSVLDWNKSAIDFYKSIGAVAMKEWTVFRLDEKAINDFIINSNG